MPLPHRPFRLQQFFHFEADCKLLAQSGALSRSRCSTVAATDERSHSFQPALGTHQDAQAPTRQIPLT